jgi:hypothetical protein
MKTGFKLPAAIAFLSTPIAAYADFPPGGIHTTLFISGFAGGFLGALFACWLWKRIGSKNDTDSKR